MLHVVEALYMVTSEESRARHAACAFRNILLELVSRVIFYVLHCGTKVRYWREVAAVDRQVNQSTLGDVEEPELADQSAIGAVGELELADQSATGVVGELIKGSEDRPIRGQIIQTACQEQGLFVSGLADAGARLETGNTIRERKYGYMSQCGTDYQRKSRYG
jgi:hypothetical protein